MKKFNTIVFFIFCSLLSVKSDGFPYEIPIINASSVTSIPFSGKNTSGQTVTLPSFESQGMFIAKEGVYNSFAGAYFDHLVFTTQVGFIIEFEYIMYTNKASTLNDVNKRSSVGDGFTFVVFDGSLSNLSTQTSGAALGYAYNRSTDKNNGGFPGAYLGIGFDAFGQFKNQAYTQPKIDWRTGIPNDNSTAAYLGRYGITNFVTVRGPVNTSLNSTYGTNKAGYPVLISQNTNLSSPPYSQLSSESWEERAFTNAYTKVAYNNSFSAFTIAGGTSNPTTLSSNYRKVRISLVPENSKSSIFHLTVEVIIDSESKPRKVIDSYKIDTNSTIYYPEVINPEAGLQAYQYIRRVGVSMKPPATLKIGWVATTGDAWANIIIKNTSISIPHSPVTKDDAATICTKKNYSSDLNPLSNDYGYGTDNTSTSSSNLDKSSFRFMVKGSSGYTANSTPYVYKSTYATYTYNPTTGLITALTTNNAPSNQKDVVYYDIKDIYRTSDNNRSNVATITYTFSDSECKQVTVLPAPIAVDDNISICNNSGTTGTLQPLTNDTGYEFNGVGGVSAGYSYLDLSSFAFNSASGVTVTNSGRDASTSNATYSYSTTTGVLTIKTKKDVTNGTTETLSYTVKNKNSTSTTRSNSASIKTTFISTLCAAPSLSPPRAGILTVAKQCSKAGTEYSFDILKNSTGYAIVNNKEVSGREYIDKTSFKFTDSQKYELDYNNPYVQTTKYAKYTFDPTTGYVHVVVLDNNISGVQHEEDIFFTIQNVGNSVLLSNLGNVAITYDSGTCKATNVWIRTNAPRKGFLINGMGSFATFKN